MADQQCSETWRPVLGYEGRYEVSSLGRVWSCKGVAPGADREAAGKMLKPLYNTSGHAQVSLCRDGEGNRQQIHRLMLAAFVGPCPPGMEVRHLNGDPADNRLANLKYGTSAENKRDTLRHGRHRESNKTHCLRGHEFTPENTYSFPARNGIGTTRSCRACALERSKRHHAQRRASA